MHHLGELSCREGSTGMYEVLIAWHLRGHSVQGQKQGPQRAQLQQPCPARAQRGSRRSLLCRLCLLLLLLKQALALQSRCASAASMRLPRQASLHRHGSHRRMCPYLPAQRQLSRHRLPSESAPPLRCYRQGVHSHPFAPNVVLHRHKQSGWQAFPCKIV